MPTYHDLLEEMGHWGPYMGDVIGKCQRQFHAFSGTGRSRIDKYLVSSATYAAARAQRNLKAEFNTTRAEQGFLIWQEGRTNGITATFPIEVDEESGVVRQLDQEVYGLLCDVINCLHRKDKSGIFIPWKDGADIANMNWTKPTQDEIDKHDATKSEFGTTVVGGKRVGQIGWRKRVAKLWGNQCAVTKCRNERLLDGAHVRASRVCTTQQRLDEQNGIYLATHIHKAFDRGLISFSSKGELLFSPRFLESDRSALGLPLRVVLPLLPERTREYLKWHRQHFSFE